MMTCHNYSNDSSKILTGWSKFSFIRAWKVRNDLLRIHPGSSRIELGRWHPNTGQVIRIHDEARRHYGPACCRCRRRESHLSLWVPNALLQEGLEVMKAWGFTYKSNLVWYKVRKTGGRTVGALASIPQRHRIGPFGTRGTNIRTGDAGRTQVNILSTRKREHFRKPDEMYDLIEDCSYDPYL